MVRPEMETVAPLGMTKMPYSPPLSRRTVSSSAPEAVIVMSVLQGGNGLCRLMVPVAVTSMVSAPGLALASSMACRSEPAPESLVLVTVKVAAQAEPVIDSIVAITTKERIIRRIVSLLLRSIQACGHLHHPFHIRQLGCTTFASIVTMPEKIPRCQAINLRVAGCTTGSASLVGCFTQLSSRRPFSGVLLVFLDSCFSATTLPAEAIRCTRAGA